MGQRYIPDKYSEVVDNRFLNKLYLYKRALQSDYHACDYCHNHLCHDARSYRAKPWIWGAEQPPYSRWSTKAKSIKLRTRRKVGKQLKTFLGEEI